uniref:Uncharacterized protein n=1 Tax=Arundo donax TaxID=35708 RepID=A0A0A9DQJ9_ARUDO
MISHVVFKHMPMYSTELHRHPKMIKFQRTRFENERQRKAVAQSS